MSREVVESCRVCGNDIYEGDRRVLVHGRTRVSYCSQACLRVGVRVVQIAQRKARLRRWAFVVGVALALGGIGWLRHRLRMPKPRRPVVAAAAPVVAPPAPPEPTPFGPSWPPTDDEWLEQFTQASWVYPLPGPVRRAPSLCRQIFVPGPASAPARCRSPGRCGVDLGGELWGEHVYAAYDGVIDRLQRSNEDAAGGLSVRIAHWGGAVFTQYFHLAAIPTRLALGMHVRAGDVVGLVGDTGDTRAHLHFALSVRPASTLPEIYWDPEPLMGNWPMHIPERGSVAGLVATAAPSERVVGTPSVGRHRPAPGKKRVVDPSAGGSSASSASSAE